jgi:hypothetical protein
MALQLEVHSLKQEKEAAEKRHKDSALAAESLRQQLEVQTSTEMKTQSEVERLKAQLLELQNCDSCLEYIKQMKGLEFQLAELARERDRALKALERRREDREAVERCS